MLDQVKIMLNAYCFNQILQVTKTARLTNLSSLSCSGGLVLSTTLKCCWNMETNLFHKICWRRLVVPLVLAMSVWWQVRWRLPSAHWQPLNTAHLSASYTSHPMFWGSHVFLLCSTNACCMIMHQHLVESRWNLVSHASNWSGSRLTLEPNALHLELTLSTRRKVRSCPCWSLHLISSRLVSERGATI